jgi:hypothetical protein
MVIRSSEAYIHRGLLLESLIVEGIITFDERVCHVPTVSEDVDQPGIGEGVEGKGRSQTNMCFTVDK